MGKFLIAVSVSLAACGSDGGGSIPLDDLAGEVERAQCEALVECGTMPDMTTCLSVLFAERSEELKSLTSAVEAGTIIYDAEKAAECLDLFRNQPCRFSEIGEAADPEVVCGEVFTGTVAEGGVCVIDEECTDFADCIPADGCTEACCVGTCGPPRTPLEPIPVGGSCLDPDEGDCVDAAFCKFDEVAGTATCTARVPEGSECEAGSCVLGFVCVVADVGPSGICTRLPDEGQSCADLPICDRSDNFCDPADDTCRARGGVGAECTVSVEGSCADYAACVAGLCTLFPASDGASCADVGDCLGELACDESMTCVAPPDEPGCTIPAP